MTSQIAALPQCKTANFQSQCHFALEEPQTSQITITSILGGRIFESQCCRVFENAELLGRKGSSIYICRRDSLTCTSCRGEQDTNFQEIDSTKIFLPIFVWTPPTSTAVNSFRGHRMFVRNLSGPLRLRVQSRSRTRLRIAASIAFLFRACLKGALDTIAPLSHS